MRYSLFINKVNRVNKIEQVEFLFQQNSDFTLKSSSFAVISEFLQKT